MAIAKSEKIYTLLYKAVDSMQGLIKKVVKPYGLNTNEYEILKYIYRNGDQPIQKIGEEIKVTSGSMTYLIDKLEKSGYLKRKPCAEDRRIMYGSLSEAGADLIEQIIPECDGKIEDVLRDFSEEEIESTIEVLRKMKREKVTTD